VRKELGIYRAMVSHNFKYERVAAVPYIERPEGQGSASAARSRRRSSARCWRCPSATGCGSSCTSRAWTGHRKRAIETLTWNRVDLEQRIINFNDPTMRLTKKRRVDGFPIPEDLHRRLTAAKARAG
jgi:heterodisulfide reductase subunit C